MERIGRESRQRMNEMKEKMEKKLKTGNKPSETIREGDQEYLDSMLKEFLEFLNLGQKHTILFRQDPMAENEEAYKPVAVIELTDTKEHIELSVNEEDSSYVDIKLPNGKMFAGNTDDAANYVSQYYLKPTTKIVPALIGREANQRLKNMETEKIPGGLAKGKTIEDIASMHGVAIEYAQDQLKVGIQTELEHTTDELIAKEIALDHLTERIDYYIELAKMESGETGEKPKENLVKEVGSQDIIELHIDEKDTLFIDDCRFPKSNKNDTLQEYEDQLDDPSRYNIETVGIRKIVVVNPDKWNEITSDLLTSRPELWESIGGSYMNDEAVKKYNVPEEQDKFDMWLQDPEHLKIFRENYYIPGIALFNRDTQEAIIINTEGYGYAKYVGFFDEFNGKIVIANYINAKVYGKFEAMDNITQEAVKTEFDSELEKINHIRKLIDERGDDILKYSAKELALLDTYTGMGGQAKKVEKGTHDVGILDQFYTPYFVIEKMIGLALKHGFMFSSGKKVLEPACGIGRFFEYIPQFCKAIGYEIDKYAATIAKLKFPGFTIVNDSFETIFFNKLKKYDPPAADFDLVIGNPPYREFISKWAVIEDSMKQNEKTRTDAFTYDQYFMMRGVDLLKPGGLLVFIIPNTFLSNDNKYNTFKDKLNRKAELVDAYRLPNRLFENTDISTDIVVLKKR